MSDLLRVASWLHASLFGALFAKSGKYVCEKVSHVLL